MFWRLLGEDKAPEANANNRLLARKDIQNLWVSGMLGSFFFAFIESVPKRYALLSSEPDYFLTLSLVLSYGYLLWFVFYFFVSNLNNNYDKNASACDLFFDVVQSILAFVAIYKLGFLTDDLKFKAESLCWASGTIVAISIISLGIFGCGDKCSINLIRIYAAVIASISLGLSICMRDSINRGEVLALIPFIVLLGILWLILWPYMFIRIDEEQWSD